MSTSYEMVGTVKKVMDVMTFPSGFSKREFVIEIQDGNYPSVVSFNCLKDNTKLLDPVQVGDNVKVTFAIRGREYNGRYFNDLVCFRLAKVEADGTSVEYDQVERSRPQQPSASAAANPPAAEPVDDDDIPF
ncbi:MAG: DUF3127 domain-containing protein [Kiritimatiellae bacterium]|nr:DUF3127 domain-containing protein [Kiritimatiellia bacterium]